MDENKTNEPRANPASDFEYTKSNGTITKLKDAHMEGEIVVPAQIESLPVTCIGDSAFESCDDLTSVTFPIRVTHIGRAAFYDCRGVTIRASRGSAAEQYVHEYAAKEKIQFEATS